MTAPPTLIDPGASPFTTFRFAVEIELDGPGNVCGGTFSEVDGLEMNIEPKTIREGGRNSGPVHFTGPVTYGQLTLKRGMTTNFDLWNWFARVSTAGSRGLRPAAEIVMISSDGASVQARFRATGCLPVKLRAPALNAREGLIAIEEMQIAYETLTIRGTQNATGAAPGAGAPAGATAAGLPGSAGR